MALSDETQESVHGIRALKLRYWNATAMQFIIFLLSMPRLDPSSAQIKKVLRRM